MRPTTASRAAGGLACLSALCLLLSLAPAPASAAAAAYSIGIPARLQYDVGGGYCGEVSLQQLMLPFGAWIPQEVARAAGGGELLLGVNYDAAMSRLRIKYDNFISSGYSTFLAWAKAKVVKGTGVVGVTFVKGLSDPDYDHIIPFVGVETATPTGGYSAFDAFFINSGYGTTSVKRWAANFSSTASVKLYPITTGGGVPVKTTVRRARRREERGEITSAPSRGGVEAPPQKEEEPSGPGAAGWIFFSPRLSLFASCSWLEA